MERALDPCEALARELLAIARGRPSQSRIDEVRARVRQVLPVLRRALGPRIEVDLKAGDTAAWVHIDPAHLESVLLNLAVNARDAMPDGGRLALEVAVEGPEERGRVVVRVADTGTGIAPEHLPRVFDPYFTTKAGAGGTGLGLASVLGTIRQHGGDVLVSSTLGAGTVFTIRLPRRASPTVLVVDDIAEVRSVVVRTLARSGVRTIEAANGEEALAILDDVAVDLVVTDYVMPRMDGKALLAALDARGGPPVLLVTGYAPDPSIGPPGGVVVLRKPFRPTELLDAVWRALARVP
jgi:CheY-like chemotaxis protein